MRRVSIGLVSAVMLALPQMALAQAGPLPASTGVQRPHMRPAVAPRFEPAKVHRRAHGGPRVMRADGRLPVYRPLAPVWYGGGGSVVSQTVIVEDDRRRPSSSLSELEDVRVVAGIRAAPVGAPTVYVLHPVSRRVADRGYGPRIVEIDPGRAEEPGPGGPRIVHLPVRRR